MFFTKTGQVIAWIGTVLGFVVMVSGYELEINGPASIVAEILTLATPQKAAAQADVFGNQGALVLFCGLVLGILSEISLSVSVRSGE